jgi:hypothetical protein
MALDFTTGVLDPRVTVTRALNTATRVNSSGYIETVNANLPRFDYDPASLAPKGLLIEEQRTNLMLRSQEFEDASFSKTNVSATANTATSPDNTTNADSVTAINGTTQHFVSQSFSFTSGVAYTISVFAKKNTLNGVQLTFGSAAFSTFPYANFDLNAGTTTAFSCTSTITNFGNGWYRCTMTATATATTSVVAVIALARDINETRIATFSSDGNGIFAWGAQLEAGAFATSYIPTVAASVTRNIDSVTMTGTNFSSWYNAAAGTLVVESTRLAISSVDAICASLFTDGNNMIELFVKNSDNRLLVFNGGSVQVNLVDSGKAIAGAPYTSAAAYSLNNYALVTNGGTVLPDTTATVPTVAALGIGSRLSALAYNGHIVSVRYWPQRLINAETQAFSK